MGLSIVYMDPRPSVRKICVNVHSLAIVKIPTHSPIGNTVFIPNYVSFTSFEIHFLLQVCT